jgi:nicotinamidase-related amidase
MRNILVGARFGQCRAVFSSHRQMEAQIILSAAKSALLAVDIQQKLLPAMSQPDEVITQSTTLLKGADLLSIPVAVSEQYPAGIGATVDPVLQAASNPHVFEKLHFSCAADAKIAAHMDKLKRSGRNQIVICGIEAHVCVLQTALGFRERGYDVAVVVDAISSRQPLSKETAIARLAMAGVIIVTTEMVLFEWLGKAGTDTFREALKLIR